MRLGHIMTLRRNDTVGGLCSKIVFGLGDFGCIEMCCGRRHLYQDQVKGVSELRDMVNDLWPDVCYHYDSDSVAAVYRGHQ